MKDEEVLSGYYDLSFSVPDDNGDTTWSGLFAVRLMVSQESVGVFNLREFDSTSAPGLTVAADQDRWYLNGQLIGSDPTIVIDPLTSEFDALVTVGTLLSSYGDSFTVK